MAQFRYEVWPVPGISGTYEKKIAALRPDSASGTLYRRQSGRGNLSIPAGYDRLDEIITVDPSNHGNDVASLIRVYRGTDLIQELLVPVSPNLVADQPATLSCEGVEAVMDWAITECWDWDGTADFTSTVPDWIYGGRNLIPDLALGDLGSIREEWDVYLSGERYDFDVVASGGFYTFTVDGNTTANINWDASRSTIKSALEALAGVTEVSVIQADPDTLGFIIVFEDPKDLSADMTKGGTAGTTLTKLNDGFDPSLNPTFTLTVDGQTTSALDWDATAKQVEGSPLGAQPGLEGLSNVNDVTVSGEGISSDPWSVTFYDPPDPTNFTATFAAGTAVLTKITEGDVDPSPVTVSQSADASRNPTTHGTYTDPPIQVVTTPLDTGADWSLLVNATGQYAGSQIILNGVTPGQIYQASINVRPTVTGLYTLVIRDQFENLIKTTIPRDNLLTAGSFQTLSISDIEIPEGVSRVIMRVAVTDPTSANWADFYVNWQGAEFREGQAATTAGQILLDLLDDAQTDHASGGFPRTTLDFINAGFDATNDSGSAAWADSELSVNIPRGMTYRKVLDRIFGQLGYEWNLTPTSGTPGEWDLNVWNPDGRGTDHSAADTPSLLLGQGTLGGSATRQIPSANRIISEGAGQFTTRARNTASEGTIGSREWYQADVSYFGEQAEEWTDKTLARFLDVSLQPRFEIADPPDTEWPIPVVDYGLADILNVDLADGGGKVSRSVEAISWRTEADGIRWGVHTGEAQFDAFPGGGGTIGRGDDEVGGRGAVAVAPQRASVALSGPVDEGVRRLLDQFDRLEDPKVASAFDPGGAGGAPTVVIRAADATETSRGKEDIQAEGTNDDIAINQALTLLGNTGGRILFTEGTFNVRTDFLFPSGAAFHFQGMGREATTIAATATSGTILVLEDNNTVSDLTLSGGGGTSVGLSVRRGCVVRSVAETGFLTAFQVNSAGTEGIFIVECTGASPTFVQSVGTGPGVVVANNFIDGDVDLGSSPGQAAQGWVVANNYIEGTVTGERVTEIVIANNRIDVSAAPAVFLGSLCSLVSIISNTIFSSGDHAIEINGLTDARIVGNYISSFNGNGIDSSDGDHADRIIVSGNHIETGGSPTTFDCIHLSADGSFNWWIIDDNTFVNGNGDGVWLGGAVGQDTDFINIRGNIFEGVGRHNIYLENVVDSTVAGNQFHEPGELTDDTYDAIHLASGSDQNLVEHNLIRPGATATRFGINVLGDCNRIVGNDLGPLVDYGTDAINDGGIDNSWRYPDDPVYGDNFTDCEPTPS